MKKRIITLIDFSEYSKPLLQFASMWVKEGDVELTLVHQVIKPVPGIGDSDSISSLKEANKETALNDLRKLSKQVLGDDIQVNFFSGTSHLVSMIEEMHAEDTVDYLFVGVNKKPVADRLLTGTTASELTKQLDQIIITFPNISTNGHIDTDILYIGINEKFHLDGKALQNLLNLVKGVVQEIHFFSILRPEEESQNTETYLQELSTTYASQIKTSYSILRSENPANAVKEYVSKKNGMLVIQKGSRTMFDLFRSFFTTDLIYEASIPVIILPTNNR